MYCNNCGNKGHVFKTCKDPITSCGIILLKSNVEPFALPADPTQVRMLMVKRKDSMAYMEFIRGKYSVLDEPYIKVLMKNMTKHELELIYREDFDTLWTKLWGSGRDTKSIEYMTSKQNYEYINRQKLISEVQTVFTEPEWGFPKGRRSKNETDIECAVREFWEETNIKTDSYEIVPNLTFVEIFTGVNNVEYKHIYFIGLLKDSKNLPAIKALTNMQKREISEVCWKPISEGKQITRPHYVERKNMLSNLERIIKEYPNM